MKSDHKIIRLTLATSFFHSLIASLLIILNVNTLFARNYKNGLYVGKVAAFFVQEINRNNVLNRVIGIVIVLFIAYSIVYPIGQTAIIHYLHDKDKSIKKALKRGRENFFQMFEYGIVSLMLSPLVYRVTVLKVAVSGGLNNWFTIFVLLFYFVAMTIINGLKLYTRYIMTLEGKGAYDAVVQSYHISLKNFKENMKYLSIQTNLIIHFSFNLFLILLGPLILIYLAIVCNLMQYAGIKWAVYGIFFLGVLFGSYASSMIRAFCVYLWYEMYSKIPKNQ